MWFDPQPMPTPYGLKIYLLSLQIQGTYKGFFMSKMYPAFVSSAWESFFLIQGDKVNPANHLKYF